MGSIVWNRSFPQYTHSHIHTHLHTHTHTNILEKWTGAKVQSIKQCVTNMGTKTIWVSISAYLTPQILLRGELTCRLILHLFALCNFLRFLWRTPKRNNLNISLIQREQDVWVKWELAGAASADLHLVETHPRRTFLPHIVCPNFNRVIKGAKKEEEGKT